MPQLSQSIARSRGMRCIGWPQPPQKRFSRAQVPICEAKPSMAKMSFSACIMNWRRPIQLQPSSG
ncbi:hypothetical protein D3C84_978010 [compost metagenome]